MRPMIRNSQRDSRRRGAVVVYMAVTLLVLIGFAALAVDIGMLYSVQAEMQRSADAAALAAARELQHDDRVKGGDALLTLEQNARAMASALAAANPALETPLFVHGDEDVEVGNWDFNDHFDGGSPLPFANSTKVHAQRAPGRGGSIGLYLAKFLGHNEREMEAHSTAAFADAVRGFQVTANSGNAQLLPFTLQVDVWNNYMAGTYSTGDNYSYDPDTGAVSEGADGVPELNLYPGAGADQLPPGSFGTVDIGSANNSSADIARQILYGINESDLSYFGGAIEFSSGGTLILNGDTGLSAGFKDELDAIKGQPRTIPLFTTVSGNGNNANYTIVAWAGIRIMNVKLTGSMSKKALVIQKAVVVDPTAIADAGGNASYFVYRPVQLVQ